MSNFKEFKSFGQAERYLRKRGVTLPKGSNERKNIKHLFTGLGEGRAVGVLRALCPCGYVGDSQRIMVVDRDSKEYKAWSETPETPTMFCDNCLQMSQALILYGLKGPASGVALKLIQKLKRGDK